VANKKGTEIRRIQINLNILSIRDFACNLSNDKISEPHIFSVAREYAYFAGGLPGAGWGRKTISPDNPSLLNCLYREKQIRKSR